MFVFSTFKLKNYVALTLKVVDVVRAYDWLGQLVFCLETEKSGPTNTNFANESWSFLYGQEFDSFFLLAFHPFRVSSFTNLYLSDRFSLLCAIHSTNVTY